MMGFDKHKGLNVVDWYKARIRRLWPSVFFCGQLLLLLYGKLL